MRANQERLEDAPVLGGVIGEDALSRFLAGLLLRLAAVAFAVTLASIGHDVSSKDGVERTGTIHQATEAGAER